MTSAEHSNGEPGLNLFTVDDPRLWNARSRLSDDEFAIADVDDDAWEEFHLAVASA